MIVKPKEKIMSQVKKCSICQEPYQGYGNNAEPLNSGTCCDKCNWSVVFPRRIQGLYEADNLDYPNDVKGQFKR